MTEIQISPTLIPEAPLTQDNEAARLAPRRRRLPRGSTLVGGVVFLIIVLLAIFAPVLRPGPNDINLAAILQAPSWAHPFGTDPSGRDLLARVLAAGRVDLVIGVFGVLISFVVGGAIGVVLGASRSRWSSVAMRGLDAIQAFPLLIFALALLAFLGQSVSTIIYAVAFVNLPIFIRLVRSEAMAVAEMPFIEAARAVGNPRWRVLSRHLLPNVLTAATTQLTTAIGLAILLTGGLSFLGVGVQPPDAEWGSLIQQGTQSLTTGQWWLSVFPGIALLITVLALQMIGEGLVRSRRVR
jgi:peptide/nickel transport system permease protein